MSVEGRHRYALPSHSFCRNLFAPWYSLSMLAMYPFARVGGVNLTLMDTAQDVKTLQAKHSCPPRTYACHMPGGAGNITLGDHQRAEVRKAPGDFGLEIRR